MGSTGSCLAGCGFPLVYLKTESKGQRLHLALEILSEEPNGLLVLAGRFSPSVADVILMRFSILHNCFTILLYDEQTSKPKHSPSGLTCRAFNQEVTTVCLLKWYLLSFSRHAVACCSGCPWCSTQHCAAAWLLSQTTAAEPARLRGCLYKPPMAGFHPDPPRSFSHSSSSLLQGPGSGWWVQTRVEAVLLELLWIPSSLLGVVKDIDSRLIVFFCMEVFCIEQEEMGRKDCNM